MHLDRTLPPPVRPIQFRPWPSVRLDKAGHLPVYAVRHGKVPIVTLRLVFWAGQHTATKTGVPDLLAAMLTEGTEGYSASTLAEALEALGAELSANAGTDTLVLQLDSPTHTLLPALDLLAEVVFRANFPGKEFDLLHSRIAANLEIQQQRTSWHAGRAFKLSVFGATHPMGRHLGPIELADLHLGDIRAHAASYLVPANAFVIVAGQFSETDVLKKLEQLFGSASKSQVANGPLAPAALQPQAPKPTHINLPNHLQATLRLGYTGINAQAPDWVALRFATLLYGGYFGSRLMKNIREEKGYTYGISAQWTPSRHVGYLRIGTDVGKEYLADTLVQIREEMDRMRQHAPDANEMEKARNYLLGNMISAQETPMQLAGSLQSLLVQGLPTDIADRNFHAIQALTPADVLAAAQAHFHPQALHEVIAGPIA